MVGVKNYLHPEKRGDCYRRFFSHSCSNLKSWLFR